MSTLIFMSQRLFLTVLPDIFPSMFACINSNKYFGVIIITLFVMGLSQLIISASKESSICRKLF